MPNQTDELKKINDNITEIKQLIDLSSMETIIATISFATLIAGITIYQNAEPEEFYWKLAGLFLILYTVQPVVLFILNFLRSDYDLRIKNLMSIVFSSTLYLIALSLMVATLWLLTFKEFLSLLTIFYISNIVPIFVFLILEIWGIFIYKWNNDIEPAWENKRFSKLTENRKKIENEKIRNILILFNDIKNKIRLPLIIIIISSLVIYSLIIIEYAQSIIILIIGIVDIIFLSRKSDDMIETTTNKTKKSEPKKITGAEKFDYKKFIFLVLFSAFIIFIGLGFYHLSLEHKPIKSKLLDNSGDHLLYDDGECIGYIRVNGHISSNIDVIAAGLPVDIKTTITFENTTFYNKSLHFQYWYIGGDRNWIIVIDDFNITSGESIVIENQNIFPTEGIYRHWIRNYEGLDITPEYLTGGNITVYGRDVAVSIEHLYLQQESNERIIGLSYVIIAISIANILFFWKRKDI